MHSRQIAVYHLFACQTEKFCCHCQRKIHETQLTDHPILSLRDISCVQSPSCDAGPQGMQESASLGHLECGTRFSEMSDDGGTVHNIIFLWASDIMTQNVVRSRHVLSNTVLAKGASVLQSIQHNAT